LRRIIVLGCAGAGKTTFAWRLGARTGVPVIVLDAVWRPHWSEDDLPEFRRIVSAAHAADDWVSDGNFAGATFDIRMPRADLVIWLDRPRWRCTWRAVRRVFRPGEAHRIEALPKVLAFIWRFERLNRPLIEAARRRHGPQAPVVHLKSDNEAAVFLDGLSPVRRSSDASRLPPGGLGRREVR
jgi:adenylate kinase family enzyme